MKPHKLNQLAIWLPMNTDELSIKAFPPGYAYVKKGIIMQSGLGNPVYRYAKNYKLGEKLHSLCIISHEADTKKLEKWLDEQSKKIKSLQLRSKFELLEVYYEG